MPPLRKNLLSSHQNLLAPNLEQHRQHEGSRNMFRHASSSYPSPSCANPTLSEVKRPNTLELALVARPGAGDTVIIVSECVTVKSFVNPVVTINGEAVDIVTVVLLTMRVGACSGGVIVAVA